MIRLIDKDRAMYEIRRLQKLTPEERNGSELAVDVVMTEKKVGVNL